jgi:ATP-binding cassette subfamily C (CFTR/MRP) protein 1
LETLDGLATIRVFSWQSDFKCLNRERLDRSQRPFYLLLCLRRWLAVVLDCVVAGFVLVIVGLAVGLRGTASAGFVAVALSNMINLSGTLSNLVLVWTQLETSMASVERIKRFREDTPSENKATQNGSLPPSWPTSGDIEIANLNATYREGATKALRHLSLSIRHGEKIGVCGRTGSGKTSLMLALFKMINISSGSIIIDGVDIADVPPNRLRSSLNAIPQEPYFFNGTVRENADPTNNKSDYEILQAFKSVYMDQAIENNGVLDSEMQSDKFSHGERQLFCLARAVLKNSKIAILDEMTSK